MHSQQTYKVAAALIWRKDELLLVEEQRPTTPGPTWALPGGVVEPGELLTEALIREVGQETGLTVVDPGLLLYVLQYDNVEDQHQLLIFVFEVAAWHGTIRVADPDNEVRGAYFLSRAAAVDRLAEHSWRVIRDPLIAHLWGEADRGALWLYRRPVGGPDTLVAQINSPQVSGLDA